MFLHWSVPVICSSLFAQRYNRFAYTVDDGKPNRFDTN